MLSDETGPVWVPCLGERLFCPSEAKLHSLIIPRSCDCYHNHKPCPLGIIDAAYAGNPATRFISESFFRPTQLIFIRFGFSSSELWAIMSDQKIGITFLALV